MVNNAGVMPLAALKRDEWKRMFDVNVASNAAHM